MSLHLYRPERLFDEEFTTINWNADCDGVCAGERFHPTCRIRSATILPNKGAMVRLPVSLVRYRPRDQGPIAYLSCRPLVGSCISVLPQAKIMPPLTWQDSTASGVRSATAGTIWTRLLRVA